MGNHLTSRVVDIASSGSSLSVVPISESEQAQPETSNPPQADPLPPLDNYRDQVMPLSHVPAEISVMSAPVLVSQMQQIEEAQPDVSLSPDASAAPIAITANYIMEHNLYTKRRVHMQDPQEMQSLQPLMYWYLINLSKLGITDLPNDLKRFTKLNVLDVSHNSIVSYFIQCLPY